MDKINDAFYSVCGIVERIINSFYRSEVNSFCLDIFFNLIVFKMKKLSGGVCCKPAALLFQ